MFKKHGETIEMTTKYNHVCGTRVSHRCDKSPWGRKLRAGCASRCGLGAAGRVRIPARVRCCGPRGPCASCGHRRCGTPSAAAAARRGQGERARRPAGSGHLLGITEPLLCPPRLAGGCLRGLSRAQPASRAQLRQRCSVSTPSIVFRHGVFPLEGRNALIFLHRCFKKGLSRQLNCFLLLFNLNLKFMGRIF